jgi:hypothetical protein
MALPDQSRSLLATIVGWLFAAIVVWLALRFVSARWDSSYAGSSSPS